MKDLIEQDLGIPIKEVKKIEIQRGKLRVHSSNSREPVIRSVKTYGDLIWPICLSCDDYTCTCADISVGSVGSEDHANTVFIRTEKGNRVIRELIHEGLVEAEELKDLAEIKRLAEFKRNRRHKLGQEERKYLEKQTVRGNWLKHEDKYRKG